MAEDKEETEGGFQNQNPNSNKKKNNKLRIQRKVMQGMSLLIVSAEIQIQKPHLRWPPQNPSLYNSFFSFFLK